MIFISGGFISIITAFLGMVADEIRAARKRRQAKRDKAKRKAALKKLKAAQEKQKRIDAARMKKLKAMEIKLREREQELRIKRNQDNWKRVALEEGLDRPVDPNPYGDKNHD
jgi:F0F1-type ATP synthase epsilon subunit